MSIYPKPQAAVLALTVLAGALLLGCGSSGSGSSGSCKLSDASVPDFTSVTKAAGSDPRCPTLATSDLNSTADAGGSCSPKVSSDGCSATFDCDSGGAHLTGSISVSGSSFTGTFDVAVPTTAGATVNCAYDVAGGVKG